MARIKIEVLSDTKDAERKLRNIQKMLEDLQKRGVSITADSNLDATIKKLAQAYEQVGQATKRGTKIGIDALHEMERAAKETGGSVSKIFDKQAGSSGRNWALERIRELQIVGDKVVAIDTLVKRTLNKKGNVEYRIISQTFTDDIGKAEIAIGKLDTKVESVRSSILTFYNTVKNSSYKYENGLFDPILQNLEQLLALTDEMRAKKADGGLEIADESKLKAISDALQTVRGDYKELTKDNERLTTATDTLVGKLGQMALQYISLTAIIQKLASAFREALGEMKNVDSQLTGIQKVTDWSTTQMEELSDAAYEVASAYGVTASAYLESVSAFAQAGYRDMADQLGELAVKTQLVGDVTSQTANEFLLAVDSAFKFGGNVEDLSRVLDEANFIENNYATSIEKLADSMPIVANVASMVGMSVEQTLAALGTITASTQETGQKAATAFRSIILNIVGKTTELEESERLTAEEMQKLNGILQTFAGDAIEAARAAGELLNPMDAIAVIAQKWSDGTIDKDALTSALYDLGGKLRVNDLMALIQNFDQYEEMLEGIAGAAGSAQKEVDTMLTSWESKANILSNTWTEFVEKTINTDLIKFFLDAATAILKFFDSIGNALLIIGSISAALNATAIRRALDDLILQFMSFKEKIITAATALETYSVSAESAVVATEALISVYAAAIAIAALVGLAIRKIGDAIDKSRQESIKNGETATQNIKTIQELYQAYEDTDKKTGELSEASYALAAALGIERDEVDKLSGSYNELANKLENATQEELKRARVQAQVALNDASKNLNQPSATSIVLGNLPVMVQESFTRLKYDMEPVEYLKRVIEEGYKALEKEPDLGILPQIQKLEKAVEEYETAASDLDYINGLLEDGFRGVARAEDETAESVGDGTDKVKSHYEEMAELAKQLEQVDDALQALTDAQTEYNNYGYLSIETIQELLALDADYLNALVDENGQINLNSESINGLIESKASLVEQLGAEAIASYAAARTEELLQQQNENTASTAQSAGSAVYNASLNWLRAGENAVTSAGGVATLAASLASLDGFGGLTVANQGKLIADVQRYANSVRSVINSLGTGTRRSGGSGGSGRSGGSSSSSRDTKLEKLKDTISLLESELTLLEKQDAPIAQQVAKIQEINKAIQDQIDYLKRTGGSQEDINKLLAKQLDYQRDIKKLEEDLWDSLRDAVERQIDDVEKLRDAELDAIDEQIEALREAHDIEDDRLTLEEKILAVQEAQAALINAQNERTIRYFNAATGQWEWGANAQNVLSAQQALEKAQEELTNYQNDLAYQAAIDELEAQKEAINAAYDVTIASWQAIVDSLEAPVATLQEVLDTIGNNATPNMLNQIEIINGLLEQFGYAINVTTNQIAEATTPKPSGTTVTHTGGSGGGGSSGSSSSSSTPKPTTTSTPKPTTTTTPKPKIGMSLGISYNAMYDEGGVLSGLGGIKATSEDEIVVPPDIASKMLSPRAGEAFRARMDELRYLYGRATGFNGRVDNSIGSVQNGDVYNVNGITLTTQQARSMTVYDLAQRSRVLSIHNSVH